MTFTRTTWTNRASDERSCATCKYAAVLTMDRTYSDLRPAEEIRCHRHPPVPNDSRELFFPLVERSMRCGDWTPDDGAQRDEHGTPDRLRCDLCQHFSNRGGTCSKNAPTAVTHEGKAVFPRVGTVEWCGDHALEPGVERETFAGNVPGFLSAARRKSA